MTTDLTWNDALRALPALAKLGGMRLAPPMRRRVARLLTQLRTTADQFDEQRRMIAQSYADKHPGTGAPLVVHNDQTGREEYRTTPEHVAAREEDLRAFADAVALTAQPTFPVEDLPGEVTAAMLSDLGPLVDWGDDD